LTRLRAHTKGIPHENLIISTLVQMKDAGLADNTLKSVSHKLNQISDKTNRTARTRNHTVPSAYLRIITKIPQLLQVMLANRTNRTFSLRRNLQLTVTDHTEPCSNMKTRNTNSMRRMVHESKPWFKSNDTYSHIYL